MVDTLSNGRLNMGVGLGNSQGEFEKAKIDFDGRRTVFEERLSELKACWSAPYDVSLESLNVRPVQTPNPRVYVATNSPDRAYQAGQEGDSVLTIVPPVAPDLSALESVVQAHGRGLSESDVDTTVAELVATVYSHAAQSEADAFENATTSFGGFMKAATGNEIPDPQALCQALVANNAALVGTSDQIAAQINQYQKLGVEHLSFLCNFGGMTSDQVAESITCLAEA